MTLDDLIQAENVGRYDDSPRYSVASYPGVAFGFDKPETEPDEDTDWSGYEVQTGNALMVMVGDDYRHRIDPADVSPISRDEYCSGCGQMGCTAEMIC